MTRNALPVSTCQMVQPLQLGAPCTPAPTLWIDPAGWPSQSRLPSTRTCAFQRRFVSVSTVPGAISPHSTKVPNATRVAALGAIIVFTALSSSRSEEHTSELQSLMRISYAVFCLKKKIKQHNSTTITEQPYNKKQQQLAHTVRSLYTA